MTLPPDEFMRRFLLHVLPSGFHRIRHYGFLANGARSEILARARRLLAVETHQDKPEPGAQHDEQELHSAARPCPCCGGAMIVIETFEPRHPPRAPPQPPGDSP